MRRRRIDDVRAALEDLHRARARLQETVDLARASDVSWAEIGRALQITRQAAFKRFGHPRDPRTGGEMKPRSAHGVLELTERVFRCIDAGDYGAVHAVLTPPTAAVVTEQVVLDTWARVVAEVGNLVGFEDTGIELGDGTRLDASQEVLGTVVGDTTLRCEAGEMRGRVAVDDDGMVVGILVVPRDQTALPF